MRLWTNLFGEDFYLSNLITCKRLSKANVHLAVELNILSILQSKEVRGLMALFKSRGYVDFDNDDDFIEKTVKKLIKSIKLGHTRINVFDCEEGNNGLSLWTKVDFNIKNQLLWKNGEIQYSDIISDEIFIPFGDKGIDPNEKLVGGITIRLILINGSLKVQVGRLSLETTTELFPCNNHNYYRQWITVTVFPLMYVAQIIPETFFNLTESDTKSYEKYIIHGKLYENSRYYDYKALKRDLSLYEKLFYLNGRFYHGSDFEKSNKKSLNIFFEKKATLLKAGNFSGDDYYDDDSRYWYNDYMRISIDDVEENRERFLRLGVAEIAEE